MLGRNRTLCCYISGGVEQKRVGLLPRLQNNDNVSFVEHFKYHFIQILKKLRILPDMCNAVRKLFMPKPVRHKMCVFEKHVIF